MQREFGADYEDGKQVRFDLNKQRWQVCFPSCSIVPENLPRKFKQLLRRECSFLNAPSTSKRSLDVNLENKICSIGCLEWLNLILWFQVLSGVIGWAVFLGKKLRISFSGWNNGKELDPNPRHQARVSVCWILRLRSGLDEQLTVWETGI